MYYQRIYIQQKNILSSLYQTQPKYRPYFQVQINLVTVQDVYNMLQVISILNTYQFNSMYIYMNYNTTNTDNDQFQVVLDSDVEIEDISQFQVGQVVNLKFAGKYGQTYMQTNLSQ